MLKAKVPQTMLYIDDRNRILKLLIGTSRTLSLGSLYGPPASDLCSPTLFDLAEICGVIHVVSFTSTSVSMRIVPPSKPFIPSPIKKRDPKKSKITVPIKTNEIKRKQLLAELSRLKQKRSKPADSAEGLIDTAESWVDIEMGQEPKPIQPMDTDAEVVVCHPPTRRNVPDNATTIQYDKWLALLPKLQPVYLQRLSETTGVPTPPFQPTPLSCSSQKCGRKTAKILCLFLDCELLSSSCSCL